MATAACARALTISVLVAGLLAGCASAPARPRPSAPATTGPATARLSAGAISGGPAVPAGLLAAAADGYARYAREQAAAATRDTAALVRALQAGQLALAKVRYVPARVAYETIETLAESVDGLDDGIDGRPADVPAASWRGFHRIEQALWSRRTTAGTTGYGRALLADMTRLQSAVDAMHVTAGSVAGAAMGLVDLAGRTKVTGEEEPYSHLDLVDLQANLGGADAAFVLLRPAVNWANPALAGTITDRFAAAAAAVNADRRGGQLLPYTALSSGQVRTLAQRVDALGEPLSQVAGTVLGA